MNDKTLLLIEHLRTCIQEYTEYRFLGSFVSEFLYGKMKRSLYLVQNETDHISDVMQMIDNQDYEQAILTIENLLEEVEV